MEVFENHNGSPYRMLSWIAEGGWFNFKIGRSRTT